MRHHTSSSPARRTLRRAERRLRRRPVLVAATLAVGVLATAAFSTATPASQAEASGSLPGFALASYSTTPAASEAAPALSAVEKAVSDASAAMTAASTVASDIAASGLDVGTPDTTVDTSELEGAVAQLQRAQTLPAQYSTEFADVVVTLTASVSEQAQGLRGKLDAAIALKAQREAEEKARKEAEAAAAAKAAEEAAAAAAAKKSAAPRSSGGGAPVFATGGAVGGTSPADAQATARSMMGGYGWGDDQFGCLVSLWNKESGWNYQAYNRSSGAFGIPQALPGSKMGSAGADWQTNPATQIAWGLGYISGRYGTPCGAWGHSQSTGWY
ncbi:lytic transglycosylase domain-containing protein [Microbacterium sp. NPDC056569]|uniref:aggregation-promoting factor C-terminal-like domain-containing protein n=1 Tax=Microbacterium sp. NPDC056569 TaxID=3345867 RepID=UPI0036705B4C